MVALGTSLRYICRQSSPHISLSIPNVADFVDSYNQEDSYYDEAINLATYMGERGDVDKFKWY